MAEEEDRPNFLQSLGGFAIDAVSSIAGGVADLATAVFNVADRPEDYKEGLNQDLAQNEYDFRYLVFPNDLGMDHMGHYMVININVPTEWGGKRTNVASRFIGEEYATTIAGAPDRPVRSKVDTLRYSGGFASVIGPAAITNTVNGTPTASYFSLPRYTRRVKESIALHMPTPIIYHHQNEYQEVSLTEVAGRVLSAPISPTIPEGGSPTLGQIVQAGTSIAAAGARLAGRPINPGVEVIFSTTYLRTFIFEVLMAPRNADESLAMKNIINTLRFHSAPELNYGSIGAGLTWIPPAEFDITFFKHGVENLNIPRISTCVMERVEVDYSPIGVYSTFRNGYPVLARLQMQFRELEPVHKLRVTQGF